MSVWYACYGSNLLRARFDVYIAGGVFPGNTRVHPGARNSGPPADERWWSRPGQVRFAEFAPQWEGAVAFLDPCADGVAHLRCYLLTDEQFDDVVAQEAGHPVGSRYRHLVDAAHPRHQGGPGWYETLWHLGELDGVDVVTFTCAQPASMTPAAPSRDYLHTIATGLAELGLAHQDIADYLHRAPGVSLRWSTDEIRQLIRL